VHRLIAAALLIACKLSHDRFLSNKRFAKVAGLQPPLLNTLELALLNALECDLYVPVDAAAAMLQTLQST
jgi:hypothetical protein